MQSNYSIFAYECDITALKHLRDGNRHHIKRLTKLVRVELIMRSRGHCRRGRLEIVYALWIARDRTQDNNLMSTLIILEVSFVTALCSDK